MRTLLMMLTLAMGALARAETFRIEIDYMVDEDHSHMPSQMVIDAVVQMFACQGHVLIIEVDDAIPHVDVLERDPADCDGGLFEYDGSPDSFGALRTMFFDHEDDDGWHYCIFAHQYEDTSCMPSGSSGIAQSPGWNLVVSLGSFNSQIGTPFDQAATLAHEFGHNLGLTHCGFMQCSNDEEPDWVGPYAPNLASIMSYRYQLAGVRNMLLCNGLAPAAALFKEIDYSQGRMCSLNEAQLDEHDGTTMLPVDWNCDDVLDADVAQELGGDGSGWCGTFGNLTFLHDYGEWNVITDPTPASMLDSREVSCITAEEWSVVQDQLVSGCAQPTLAVETCLQGENVYLAPSSATPGPGWCVYPFVNVQQAHDGSPPGSVYFFRPGVYDHPGPVILDQPGLYLSNIGTATIR